MKTTLIVILSLLLLPARGSGQDLERTADAYRGGIGMQDGVGRYAVRDDHISEERYSGVVSWFVLDWFRFHDAYGYHTSLRYERGRHIRNYDVSADVAQGALAVDFLYPLGQIGLFGRTASLFLGPGSEAYIYYRQQNIALNPDAEPDVYISGYGLLALAANLEMTLPLAENMEANGTFRTSLLSMGVGTEGTNGSPGVRLLTPISGLHTALDVAVRYRLWRPLSVEAGYRMEFQRINAWNFVLSRSDNAFLSLRYDFR